MISADTLYQCYCIDKETGDRRRSEVFELVRICTARLLFLLTVHFFFKFEYNSRHQRQQSQQQQQQQQQQHRQQQTRIHRPQPAPPPPPHAQQPISQRVEGIVSPETSPELSPTDFQVDLEAGIRHPHPRLPLPPPPARAQSLRRQESSEINPFLPDLDPEPEPEPELLLQDEAVAAAAQRGYDVGPHSEDEEEGLGSSALFPGSDIF